jgi:hypothetical protein
MDRIELSMAAKMYAKRFEEKKSPINLSEIEDAYLDGYNKAIEYINSLLDRKTMSITADVLEANIKDYYYSYDYTDKEKDELEMCTMPIFMFVDYVNKQSDFGQIIESKLNKGDIIEKIQEEFDKIIEMMKKNAFTASQDR